MSTPVQNKTYYVFVEQVGGGPCVMFTLTDAPRLREASLENHKRALRHARI
jgi:hypothetical protein